MNARPLIAAASAIALAVSLAACSTTATPSSTSQPVLSSQPTTSTDTSAAPATSASPSAKAVSADGVKMRDVIDGADLTQTASNLRTGFPSWKPFSDDDVAVILNAGCDSLDASQDPQAASNAIAAYGLEPFDAAFGLLAAISTYCPEYSQFLAHAGSGN